MARSQVIEDQSVRVHDDQIVEILEYLDIVEVWKAFGPTDQKAIAKATTEVQDDAA
jgi:hypothetical protein